MKNILRKLLLNREAVLFDSHLYILKGFLGILTGYVLFDSNAFIGRDMISLLFGMMLTLEPVNTTGLKTGFNQFKASFVGGMVTAVIVGIFGINFITVALSMALTMYVSLLIDWKSILPVAIFTSIYMTQVIQYTTAGDPSMLLTLQLRFVSLGTGVLIAVVYNYLFSILFYKSMIRKRIVFLFERTASMMERYCIHLEQENIDQLKLLKREDPLIFGDIDFVYGHVSDLSKEKKKREDLKAYLEIILEIRDLNHYFLDLVMRSLEEKDKRVIGEISIIRQEIIHMAGLLEAQRDVEKKDVCCFLYHEDVSNMGNNLTRIYSLLNQLTLMNHKSDSDDRFHE
ncbi:MAG: hypothetical protein JXQ23_04730 [Clostridia bacterium]|nr:hypothetical protein [Clostridia bacterium]